MDLSRLREFGVFAKHLNITRASNELFITQSNLSKHFRQLQEELGFDLVARKGNQLTLTYEGERFLTCCNTIIGLYDSTVSKCIESQKERRGGLTVQEPSYRDKTAEGLYELVDLFCEEATEASIKFFRPYRKNVLDELKSGNANVILTYREEPVDQCLEEYEQQGLTAKPLAEDCLRIWCDQEHELASLEDVGLKDLQSTEILSPSDVYTPIRNLLLAYAEEYECRLNFTLIESDQSTTFISLRRPNCVYVLPASAENDMRITVRKNMVFRTLERDALRFVSYAVVRTTDLEVFPELKRAIEALPTNQPPSGV